MEADLERQLRAGAARVGAPLDDALVGKLSRYADLLVFWNRKVNLTAIRDPADIVGALVAQVTGTVRWRDSISFMADAGVTRFCEVGAGKVLSGLVKRIAEGAIGVSVGTPDDVTAFKTPRP